MNKKLKLLNIQFRSVNPLITLEGPLNSSKRMETENFKVPSNSYERMETEVCCSRC